MSTIIKLDAPALRALIAADPQFEFELQRAVVAEVIRNTLMPKLVDEFSKITTGLIAEIAAEIRKDEAMRAELANTLEAKFKREWNKLTLKPDAKAQVHAEAKVIFDTLTAEAIREAGLNVTHQLSQIEDRARKLVDEGLPSRIEMAVKAYEAAAIDRGVADKLNALRASL